jgi:hypothetical protein
MLLLLLLSRGRNNQPLPSAAMAGGGWQCERIRFNDTTSLSQTPSTIKLPSVGSPVGSL